MQISQIDQVFSHRTSIPKQVHTTSASFSDPSHQTPPPEAIDTIKSRYDVTNITPDQADQAADELFAAGVSLRDLIPLHHAGTRFQGHLNQIASQVFAQQGVTLEQTPTSSNAPVNLLQIAEDQLELARQSGRDLTQHTHNIDFLRSFSNSTAEPGTAIATAVQAALKNALT